MTATTDFLNHFFDQRKERNPRYSLRSFARDLHLAPGTLSLLLNGKRPLTLEKALEVADHLRLEGEERAKFLEKVEKEQIERRTASIAGLKRIQEKYNFQRIQGDQLKLIKNWYHLGILNIVKLPNFKNDPQWMAKILGVSESKIRTGLSRLKRLGLLEEKEGNLTRSDRPLETPTDIPSRYIRTFHKSVIERSLESLEKDDVMERDMSSIMFCGDSKKMEEAKRRIRLFRKELAAFLEEGEGDRVYSLNIQLFPQTLNEESKQ
jgi:uncharacterized protein (TIGR02147 family)